MICCVSMFSGWCGSIRLFSLLWCMLLSSVVYFIRLLWEVGNNWFLGVLLILCLECLICCRKVVMECGDDNWQINLMLLILMFSFSEVVVISIFNCLVLRCCLVFRCSFLVRLLWWVVIWWLLRCLVRKWVICLVMCWVLMNIRVVWCLLVRCVRWLQISFQVLLDIIVFSVIGGISMFRLWG